MFPIYCNQQHETNLAESCCINHLIEMHFFAENKLLGHKYAKLLSQTLNHHFKRNNIQFDSIKLETAKIFIDILSKYVTYYYSLDKMDLAKLLTKIALKLTDANLINDISEIILRKSAVYNNLSAIYESLGKYGKSLQYLKTSYKYLSHQKLGNTNKQVDMAIFYNNLARISLKQNKENSCNYNHNSEEYVLIANQAMKMCYDLVREESLRIIREKSSDKSLSNSSNYLGNSAYTMNTFRLFGFLYYNYGCFLSLSDMARSMEIFKQGYEFTMCTLNEFDEVLFKFRIKLQFVNFPKNFNKNRSMSLKHKETFESKYESDVELPPILDRNNGKSRNKSQEVIEKNSDYNSVDVINHRNNLSFTNRRGAKNEFPTNYEDMIEIKNKVDMLINKFEELKNVSNPITLNNTSNSQPVKIIRTDKRFDTTKEINIKHSSLKYEKLKNMIKPKISKLISEISSKNADAISRNSFQKNVKDISVITKKPTNFTEEYLQELVNEFENSREFNNSKDLIKINDLNRSKSSKSSTTNINSDNFLTGRINEKDNMQQITLTQQKESSKTSSKPKRKMKDILSKLIPENILKNIEKNTSSNQKADDGKMFTKLITNLIDDNETNLNFGQIKQGIKPKSKIPSEIEINNIRENLTSPKTIKEITSNISSNRRNSMDLNKNNLMGIPENINLGVSNDNCNLNNPNNVSSNKSASDKILPSENICKILITPDNEDIDLWQAKTFYVKRSNSKEKIDDSKKSNERCEYKINLQLDDEEFKYESKTFFIRKNSNENEKNSTQSIVSDPPTNNKDNFNNYQINVELDNEDYSYKPKTFYIKRRPKIESNQILSDNKPNTVDDSLNSHFTANFAAVNKRIENHKEIQIDSNDYSSENNNENLPNDDESKQIEKEKFMTFTINNDVRMITLDIEESGDDSKDLIESEKIIQKDYITFNQKVFANKQKSEKDFRTHFESLLEKYINKDGPISWTSTKKIFSIIRELENSFYKISISTETNEKNEVGVQFKLYRELTKDSISQSFITYEKLKNSLTKLSLYNSLSLNEDLFDLNNLEEFLERILIYHCNLFKTSKNISIGLLTRPIGLCANNLYEFTFLNALCFIDILIIQSAEVKLTIYNKKNETLSIQFNLILNEKDFGNLFKKYCNKMFIKDSSYNETLIDSYEPLDEIYMIKDGLIADIVLGIEKYLIEKTKIKNLKFDEACQRLQKAAFKIYLKEDLKNIELWSIFCEESNVIDNNCKKNDHNTSHFDLMVDFLTLKPIQVKNEKVNIRLHHIIKQEEFRSIFGFDSLQAIKSFLTNRDLINIAYILLNSLKINYTTNQIANMSKSEIRRDLKIISADPLSLFNYSYVTKEQSSIIYIINLEYLIYNNFCSFYRLSLNDTLTGDTFVKIFKHKIEAKKFLDEQKFTKDLKSKLDFNYSKSNHEFKKLLDEYLNKIDESDTFSLFDTIDNFFIF